MAPGLAAARPSPTSWTWGRQGLLFRAPFLGGKALRGAVDAVPVAHDGLRAPRDLGHVGGEIAGRRDAVLGRGGRVAEDGLVRRLVRAQAGLGLVGDLVEV